ncbi:MAG: glycosyltransferase [Dehalococcoidales bacterium]|nr:MAG: glycosyltransferase [Dehalococcoidales bacterium]
MAESGEGVSILTDGTVYSRRKDFCPLSTPPVEAYTAIMGDEKIERLHRAAQQLKGRKLLEINSTAEGGGVAEILYSSIPLLNALGVEAEWKVVQGSNEYFECTKSLHNLLQGMEGDFTTEMERIYTDNLDNYDATDILDYQPDVVLIHDPQPLGLVHRLRQPEQTWLWRCHIDIEEEAVEANPSLWKFITDWTERYDAAIFSAAHYIVTKWPLPKFIIPPFIDPLSEKNRELAQDEIDSVLAKYQIDPDVPIIAQVGRFDPWKGIDRTIAVFRRVREEKKCQLILAGALAADDPEGERILADICQEIKDDEDIRVLNLSLANRLENHREVNAIQRAARVIMQPSTREGFGLVITEALWKGKPVIAADVGAIPLQIREDDTGYFYDTPYKTAEKVLYLLENPGAAEVIGEVGSKYVKEHFLLPDRLADQLMAIQMAVDGIVARGACPECIVSFHPWFKLHKRR